MHFSPVFQLTVYGKHTDPAKSTTLDTRRQQASNQSTNQPIHRSKRPPETEIRRRDERETRKIHDGRIYSNDVCHFDSIDRWLKVKPSSFTREAGGRACSVDARPDLQRYRAQVFPSTKDAFPTIERRRSVTAIPLVRDPYPDSSYIPLYLTADLLVIGMHRGEREGGPISRRHRFSHKCSVKLILELPSEYTQPLESLKKYFLPDRSSCPWNGTAALMEDLECRGSFQGSFPFPSVDTESI